MPNQLQIPHVLFVHRWKIIPVSVLFIIWTILSLQTQYRHQYSPPYDSLSNVQKLNGEDSSTSSSSTSPPFCTPPPPSTSIPDSIPTPIPTHSSKARPLILYTYAESETARENFEYFIKKGLHSAADFIFIFNGETNATGLIPSAPNIQIMHRENKCFDLGTIGDVLAKDGLWKKYKKFITLNASVRGPFLPTYSSGSCWSDLFLDRIDERVKLVGTTINCRPWPHVQSMLLATDDIGMSILLDPTLASSVQREDYFGTAADTTGFTPCYDTMHHAIHGEMGLTELIRGQGYEVDVMLAAFQGEAETPTEYCDRNGNPEDILYDNHYYGTNVHPYELVFIKANRNIDPTLLREMTKWHLSRNVSSGDTCGSGSTSASLFAAS